MAQKTKAANKRRTMKLGAVSVEIYPWRHPSGRDYWRWDGIDPESGRRKQITGATPEKLADKVRKHLRGTASLDDLPSTVRERLSRILSIDPLLNHYSDFLAWMQTAGAGVTLAEAAHEFLAAKENSRGRSERHIRSLRGDIANLLAHVPSEKPIAAVTVQELEEWMQEHKDKSAKRRSNLRGSAVTLFRWARRRKYLPHELTAAEVLEVPKVTRQIPPTYSIEDGAELLKGCPKEYLPWLVFSGWHGLRYSELFPPYGSDKLPLTWEDVDFKRGLIVVRPETSKMNERRVIPLVDGALNWLPRDATGRVTPMRPPNKVLKHEDSVNTKLGNLVGGWKPNGLRNSFISYRAAVVGLAQTALEAGNSESEARRSYHDAKSREEGEAWFELLSANIG